MAGVLKSLGKSAADWSKEKVHQSKENHVLDLMIEIKDEGLTFEQYKEMYENVNKLRESSNK